MSHRTHHVRGVKHPARCCCPVCDPRGLLSEDMARLRTEAPPASVAAPVAAKRWFARTMHAPRPAPSEETKRFRALLAAGLTAAEAIAKIETEKGNP